MKDLRYLMPLRLAIQLLHSERQAFASGDDYWLLLNTRPAINTFAGVLYDPCKVATILSAGTRLAFCG